MEAAELRDLLALVRAVAEERNVRPPPRSRDEREEFVRAVERRTPFGRARIEELLERHGVAVIMTLHRAAAASRAAERN